MDGCWLQSDEGKKVDYLFWGQSATGRKMILLVELKEKNFGMALEQIKSTLARLCKLADSKGIHIGTHHRSPGHDQHNQGGVRAHVVLSKGTGVRQRQQERERIRRKYGVIVHPRERFEINGLDDLP